MPYPRQVDNVDSTDKPKTPHEPRENDPLLSYNIQNSQETSAVPSSRGGSSIPCPFDAESFFQSEDGSYGMYKQFSPWHGQEADEIGQQ